MRKRLLEYIGCPVCLSEFIIESKFEEEGHVIEGQLVCTQCEGKWQIVRGVPRLTPKAVEPSVRDTVRSFGFEWNYFCDKLKTYKEYREFLTLIPPITAAFFADKVVLDAGCGMGRLSAMSAAYGASYVIGVDLSDSVDAAFSHTKKFPNVDIMQCDLRAIPLRRRIDFAFSLGVLHHMPSGLEGFAALCKHLKSPGGIVGVWVYGKEGNVIMRAIQAVPRAVTTRLSGETNVRLSTFVTRWLEAFYRLVYMPLSSTLLHKFLFYKTYLDYFHTLSFHDRQSTVFDLMSTRIVRYYSRDEVERWIRDTGLKTVRVYHRNSNSWSVVAAFAPVPSMLSRSNVS